MITGSVEVNMPYGGDIALDATGDWALVQDAFGSPAATLLRLQRLILTTPLLTDSSGAPIGRPDDLFNVNYGAGIRALVGEPITQQMLASAQSRVMSALAQDPGVAASPAPVVSVQSAGNGFMILAVSCTAITGQQITLPAYTLKVLGS